MIKLPSDSYIIDNDCILYLFNTTKEYVIHQAKRYLDYNINIQLHNEKHRIKYNRHIYNIYIIKQNRLLYFYLEPYKGKGLQFLATSYEMYETLINAMKEHDKWLSK